ncbi:methyltransferase domain-containing protein [Ureibacillus sp. FSL K6-8385]|nr:class I SAM-dependent methyltransferase [Ureibacillus terrenus]
MNSYGRFAEVYDVLMQDIPYEKYVEWVAMFAPSSKYPALLDVGCGTGTLSILFQQAGYKVSGIDLSDSMLAVAQQRAQEAGLAIPFYQMSMEELEGFSDIDVIVIPIDSINYLQEEHQVKETFKRIFASLRPGGQLFFDIHSIYKMNEIFLESPFTYDDGEIVYIWYTEKREAPHSVQHDITFFVLDDSTGLYERFDEQHVQRTFPVEMYEAWLKEAGFDEVFITADWENKAPCETSERIFIRAVK